MHCLTGLGRRRSGDLRAAMRLGVLMGALAGATHAAWGASAPKQEKTPDFGPNVTVFDPSMPAGEIQARIDKVYKLQEHSEFGFGRNAFLFRPGHYKVDVPVGFYTEVVGLGASPDAVHITGNVHADASLPHNNATCTFWRAAEGFSVTPRGRRTSCRGPFRRPFPSAACTCWAHGAAPERRLGQRRMDVRLAGGRPGGRGIAAAVV